MSRKHLGKVVKSYSSASFKTLDPIPRNLNNDSFGMDFWNAFEFTYLDKNKLPVLRVLEISIPSDSKNIVESKSLKIYLNSFYNKQYSHKEDVLNIIKKDLDKITKASINIRFINKFSKAPESLNLNTTKLKKLLRKEYYYSQVLDLYVLLQLNLILQTSTFIQIKKLI